MKSFHVDMGFLNVTSFNLKKPKCTQIEPNLTTYKVFHPSHVRSENFKDMTRHVNSEMQYGEPTRHIFVEMLSLK